MKPRSAEEREDARYVALGFVLAVIGGLCLLWLAGLFFGWFSYVGDPVW